MPAPEPYRNPMAAFALFTSITAFLISLAMLGLKFGVGPATVLYWIAQVGGALFFGLVVVGSGLAVIAMARTAERKDRRVPLSFLLLLLSVVCFIAFAAD